MIFTINALPHNFSVRVDQGVGSSWHGRMDPAGFMELWAAGINPLAPFLARLDLAQHLAWDCLAACNAVPCAFPLAHFNSKGEKMALCLLLDRDASRRQKGNMVFFKQMCFHLTFTKATTFSFPPANQALQGQVGWILGGGKKNLFF